MNLQPHLALLARYNRWMNLRLYEACGQLPPEALAADRGAYFGSILGTLNHILVGDRVWLQRFAEHPSGKASLAPVTALAKPATLDQLLFRDFAELCVHRRWLDELICAWIDLLSEDDLDDCLAYRNMKGVPARRPFASLLLHFFNHQTHHRGQATTLLHQAGQDVGVTDLLALIPDDDLA
ncbi:DinB family protein [Pseudomonas benzenivorans]|uniref:DinB family protein n=1 Tax=Pseudomonas benzenivorans TaxID=556533 RepID=A0ABZ0Q0H7_9PSED|nr:DinB family protein [Pseudomonas benzenivorans]WPC06972.1 DinB family protein [Pseudomonas benzenivorans]